MSTPDDDQATDGPLTNKQDAFVREYLVDLNATQAAIRAGYSADTAKQQGSRLLTNVDVQDAIATAMAERAARVEIKADDVLAELAKLGFSNMLDYMRIGPDADPHLDFSTLTRDQAAAISEVTVEDYKDGRGEDARDVRRIKFKLADKRAALVDIGKHLGMFTQRHELTGKDGAPIEHRVKLTGRDLARRIALTLASAAQDEDGRGERG